MTTFTTRICMLNEEISKKLTLNINSVTIIVELASTTSTRNILLCGLIAFGWLDTHILSRFDSVNRQFLILYTGVEIVS